MCNAVCKRQKSAQKYYYLSGAWAQRPLRTSRSVSSTSVPAGRIGNVSRDQVTYPAALPEPESARPVAQGNGPSVRAGDKHNQISSDLSVEGSERQRQSHNTCAMNISDLKTLPEPTVQLPAE